MILHLLYASLSKGWELADSLRHVAHGVYESPVCLTLLAYCRMHQMKYINLCKIGACGELFGRPLDGSSSKKKAKQTAAQSIGTMHEEQTYSM